jgi:glycerol-3-phosphate cytidylyltransferase-like family protein
MDSLSGWTRPRASNASSCATSCGTCWRDVLLDAKQRKLIWPDAERLDLEQSIQRVQKKYPDFPRDEVEEFLLDWIDMGYDPENYSQAQLDELDSLTKRWVADHLQKANASKKQKRTRHS